MAKTTLEVLKDWTLANIRHKDLLRREVVEIEQEKDGWTFIVHSKTGGKFYSVALAADFGEVAKRAEGKSVVVVVPNTKENLNALATSWNQLVKLGSFCVYFVNPYSLLEKYWTVCPAVHEKIADKTTLKKGLEAMFVTVEPYVESPKAVRLS